MKNIIKKLLIIFLLFQFPSSYAQFLNEYWQNFSHRKTNYSDVTPEPREDFSLLITVIKPGYRFYINDEPSSSRISLDVYGRFEHVHDFRYKTKFHDNVYNNHYKYGFGVRLRIQKEDLINHWIKYLHIDLFAETQKMETWNNDVEYWFDFIEQQNNRFGLNAWLNSNYGNPFGQETYLDLSYHSTNFSDPGHDPYLILTLSPKLYYNISRTKKHFFDLYINEELVKDFMQKGSWNRNPFSNNLKTILGIRAIFPLNENFNLEKDHIFYNTSFLIFSEYSAISYLDDKSDWPWQTELANHDFRFGFMIWWPLGEAKYTPLIQNRF